MDDFRLPIGSMLQHPTCNEGTVAHVGFFDGSTAGDAHELGNGAIQQIGIILALIGFGIGKEPQFHQLSGSHIVKGEEVGTGFFDGGGMSLEGIGTDTRQQLSGTVAETLMEVGMEVVAGRTVSTNHLARGLVDDKLVKHAASLGGTVVGLGEITDSDTL